MSKDVPFTIQTGDNIVGTPCPVCDHPFTAGDDAIACPRCKLVHHRSCWYERGGCTRHGCSQVAQPIVADEPRLTDDDLAKQYNPPLPKWIPWTAAIVLAFVVFGIPILRSTIFADKRPRLMLMVPTTNDDPLINEVVQAFRLDYPEYQVVLVSTPMNLGPNLYEQKLAVMIGARDAPDVFALPWARFSAYAEQGLLIDLSDHVQQNPAYERIPAHRFAGGQVDGVTYGVPHPGRSLFFGIFINTPHAEPAMRLLESVVAALPVDESVVDEYRVEPLQLPRLSPIPGM